MAPYTRPTPTPSSHPSSTRPTRPSTSTTQTITTPIPVPPSATLRLRAALDPAAPPPEAPRHVQWAPTVINNENMGKKSSKGLSFPSPARTPRLTCV